MKAISLFLKENRQTLATTSWTILAVVAIFLLAATFTGISPRADANIWYWAAIISYLVVGGVMSDKIDEDNIDGFVGKVYKGLLIINVLIIIFSFVCFVLHFFLSFPPPIQAICGWSAAMSCLLFIMLTAASVILTGLIYP